MLLSSRQGTECQALGPRCSKIFRSSSFFTGKGGVGKTSLACATALQLAERASGSCWSAPILPPMSGQVFGMEIGNHVTDHSRRPIGLNAIEIDPEAAAAQYRPTDRRSDAG